MKLSFQKLIDAVSSKARILLIGFIVLFQLVILGFDLTYNINMDEKYYQEMLVDDIIVLVDRLNASTQQNKAEILEDNDINDGKTSVDPAPKWPLQFQKNSILNLNNKLLSNKKDIHLSVQLANHQWLNISANLVPFVSRLQTYIFGFELMTTILILFLLRITNRFTFSLNEIKEATQRLGLDLNTTPIKPSGPALVRHTLVSINQLQERVQQLLHERTRMIAAISHDLRTPMTRIRLRSEAVTDEQYQKNMEDLDEMEAMVSETLAFLRDDHQQIPKNPTDLTALLTSICNDFVDAGSAVNYVGTEERITMLGASLALKRAFINIIDNALKYAGAAEVNLQKNESGILVVVSDKGPGLSDEDLENVFKPFYRINKSRSRRTGGTGLGLTIAKNIISTHQGVLSLERQTPKGLRVIVTFSAIS